MQTAVVSSLQGLESALRDMRAGGVVFLQPGDYGRLLLNDYNPTGRVTIRSWDPSQLAHFDGIVVQRSSLLTFSSLDIGQPAGAGPVARGTVSIGVGEARDMVFSNLTFHGNGNGDPTDDPMGIRIRASQRVEVVHSTFTEMHRAVVANTSDHITIARNAIENMSEDGLNFGDVQSLYIRGNLIGNYSRILDGQHPDGIQIQTAGTSRASKNIFIENNIIYQGEGQVIQGIFMGNEIALPYENVNISNNLIFTQQYHGISIGIANGVDIRDNTVLSTAGDAPYSWIMLNRVNGGTVTNNVAEDYVFRDSTGIVSTSNLDLGETPVGADLLSGMRDLLPLPESLIIPDRGFQGAVVGPAVNGSISFSLGMGVQELLVPQGRQSAVLTVEEHFPANASAPTVLDNVAPTEQWSSLPASHAFGLYNHWDLA